MVGGMLTALLLSLFVIPAAWRLLQERKLAMQSATQAPGARRRNIPDDAEQGGRQG